VHRPELVQPEKMPVQTGTVLHEKYSIPCPQSKGEGQRKQDWGHEKKPNGATGNIKESFHHGSKGVSALDKGRWKFPHK